MLDRATITLSNVGATFLTSKYLLHPKMQALTVRLARRTTATPGVWPDDTGTLAVRIRLILDGVVQLATGQCSGGIRLRPDGSEMAQYRMTFSPTYRFSTGRCIIEDAVKAEYQVELELLQGTVDTLLTIEAR